MPPLEAIFTAWSNGDSVGRLRLETGEELRVGASACEGFVPQLGLKVLVSEVGPHPLGGRKATRVDLLPGTDADALLDAARPLPGLRGDVAALDQEVAVIVHQAPGCLMPAAAWLAALDADPISAWTSIVEKNGTVGLNGLLGLLLPNLYMAGAAAATVGPVLRQAARELVALGQQGRMPHIGEALGGSRVLNVTQEWIELAP